MHVNTCFRVKIFSSRWNMSDDISSTDLGNACMTLEMLLGGQIVQFRLLQRKWRGVRLSPDQLLGCCRIQFVRKCSVATVHASCHPYLLGDNFLLIPFPIFLNHDLGKSPAGLDLLMCEARLSGLINKLYLFPRLLEITCNFYNQLLFSIFL